VALEALTAHADAHIPFLDTGSLRGDLLAFFARLFPALQDEFGKLLRGLAAEAQLDADFARDFQRLFIEPRREAFAQAIVDLVVRLNR
jgi:hypothetical protein